MQVITDNDDTAISAGPFLLPDDSEARRSMAAIVFSDPRLLREVLPTLQARSKELKRHERFILDTVGTLYQESVRTFVALFTLYLACARDSKIARKVDNDCSNVKNTLPVYAERLVCTYMSDDPGAVVEYGRALVGAALSDLTPLALLDELTYGALTVSDLAIKGGLTPDQMPQGNTILTLKAIWNREDKKQQQ